MNHSTPTCRISDGWIMAAGLLACLPAGPRYTPLAYRDSPLAPLMPMNLDTVSVPDSDALGT
jgi:hypothetical protein